MHVMTAFEKKSIPPEACCIAARPGNTVEFLQEPAIQKPIPHRAETMTAKSEIKPSEKRFAEEFNSSGAIQREFGDVSYYVAFRKAQEQGRVRIFSRQVTNGQ